MFLRLRIESRAPLNSAKKKPSSTILLDAQRSTKRRNIERLYKKTLKSCQHSSRRECCINLASSQ